MSGVIDASVLVAALVDSGPDGEWAEKFLTGGDLRAPELVRVEAANSLRRLQRVGKLRASEANAAYEDMLQLNIELLPFEPFAERIWELRSAVTSYDAWYVAVAEALGLSLATLDGRLIRASGPRCWFMTPAGLQQPGRPAMTRKPSCRLAPDCG